MLLFRVVWGLGFIGFKVQGVGVWTKHTTTGMATRRNATAFSFEASAYA